jgi:hypothetical protein
VECLLPPRNVDLRQRVRRIGLYIAQHARRQEWPQLVERARAEMQVATAMARRLCLAFAIAKASRTSTLIGAPPSALTRHHEFHTGRAADPDGMEPTADIPIVIPAHAGTQGEIRAVALGPRFRGDDNGERFRSSQ